MISLRSIGLLVLVGSVALAEDIPDYETKVAPLFNKYCSACHNGEDLDGGFNLESFAALQEGGDNGPALLPGDAKSSKLIRDAHRAGQAEDAAQGPARAHGRGDRRPLGVDRLRAKGPKGLEPDRTTLHTPQIAPAKAPKAITGRGVVAGWKPARLGRFGKSSSARSPMARPSALSADCPAK